MLIKSIEYITSSPEFHLSPNIEDKPEITFIGRSNVGKSSLINYLANKKNMAYVSNSPGKTLHFNYYWVNKSHYWVDVPGYGFAKVSQKQRSTWIKNWNIFIDKNKRLSCIFLLIDSRIPFQVRDQELINALLRKNIPWSIVFTKAEKVKSKKINLLLNEIQLYLGNEHPPIPYFITSSTTKFGREEILSYIEKLVSS